MVAWKDSWSVLRSNFFFFYFFLFCCAKFIIHVVYVKKRGQSGDVHYGFKAIQFSILFPFFVLSPFFFLSHPFLVHTHQVVVFLLLSFLFVLSMLTVKLLLLQFVVLLLRVELLLLQLFSCCYY